MIWHLYAENLKGKIKFEGKIKLAQVNDLSAIILKFINGKNR